MSAVIGAGVIREGLKPLTTSHTPSDSSQAATGSAASSGEPTLKPPNSVAITVQMGRGAPVRPPPGKKGGTGPGRDKQGPRSTGVKPGMRLWLSRNVQL